MASTIRIKRRHTGAGGLPSSLRSGEIAWTDVSDILCIGEGDDGSGNANSVTAIGGTGAFVDLSNSQTIAGAKTFAAVPKSSQDASGATDLVRKSQFDSGLAAKAAVSHSHSISDTTGLQSALDGKLASGATAAAATKLATSRTIGLSGDASGSIGFDGTANVTITVTIADDSHNHIIGNVDGLQAKLDLKAPLASPALTGTPTAPTASPGTNTTQVSTTAFVQAAVSGLIDAAPGALDTLNELAAALGDDPNFASTITSALALKAPLASPALTGNPTAPSQAAGNNTTRIATTAFVQGELDDRLDEIDGGTF